VEEEAPAAGGHAMEVRRSVGRGLPTADAERSPHGNADASLGIEYSGPTLSHNYLVGADASAMQATNQPLIIACNKQIRSTTGTSKTASSAETR